MFFTLEMAARILAASAGETKWNDDALNWLDLIATIGCWGSCLWPDSVPGFGAMRLVRVLWIIVDYGEMREMQKVALPCCPPVAFTFLISFCVSLTMCCFVTGVPGLFPCTK